MGLARKGIRRNNGEDAISCHAASCSCLLPILAHVARVHILAVEDCDNWQTMED